MLTTASACTELADPRRFYLDCYQQTEIVIETELHEDAYCWIKYPRPYQWCQEGDTVPAWQIDTERPECFRVPVPPRP